MVWVRVHEASQKQDNIKVVQREHLKVYIVDLVGDIGEIWINGRDKLDISTIQYVSR